MKTLHAAGSGLRTTAHVKAPAAKPRDPEFCRLPKVGTLCPYTGLTRSKMNELILPCPQNGHKPPVRSLLLRQPGKARGCRLIVFKSLIEYLHRQLSEAA
ncbi:MAG TPA: hypothetical protein VL171_18800 [Verrucomicrobiae bacterium]|nr:hypothetical protein [Verrucomicrobiae bacterium]